MMLADALKIADLLPPAPPVEAAKTAIKAIRYVAPGVAISVGITSNVITVTRVAVNIAFEKPFYAL